MVIAMLSYEIWKLDEMGKFLEKCYLLKLTQKAMKKIKSAISILGINV